MKFHFIREHREIFRVAMMCKVLRVSRSGFYAWLKRPLPRRPERDEALVNRIRQVHARSHGTYGSPRVHRALKKQGVVCGQNRVARLMQRESIVAISHISTAFLRRLNARSGVPGRTVV